LANANFHRGRNTKDTVTAVKERKKEDRAWAVLSSSSSTAEDPPYFLLGLSLFLNYGVRILYLFIFPIPDALCFVYVGFCVYERRRRISYSAKDPPWSFSTPPCETHSLSTHQYNAPENEACALIVLEMPYLKISILEYCLNHFVLFK
jgi:hypothetical protein